MMFCPRQWRTHSLEHQHEVSEQMWALCATCAARGACGVRKSAVTVCVRPVLRRQGRCHSRPGEAGRTTFVSLASQPASRRDNTSRKKRPDSPDLNGSKAGQLSAIQLPRKAQHDHRHAERGKTPRGADGTIEHTRLRGSATDTVADHHVDT